MDIIEQAYQVVHDSITPHDSLLIAMNDISPGEQVEAFDSQGSSMTLTKMSEGGWFSRPERQDMVIVNTDWIVAFTYNGWRIDQDDFEREECDHHDQCEEFMRLHRDK
jgi:hypothetical protein